ncbi:hypothetical protein [Otariodibacter oris]|uniref:Uncharacterized protein n=1 Tax=Otariodibacter oris TaxID=1032623 RepID=A0A420XI68_9PAST|nr:hypothetical protein [Otariodibacter oris]RKR76848.1 hypothetical protein DES31_0156 [Otariodibacter oris]
MNKPRAKIIGIGSGGTNIINFFQQHQQYVEFVKNTMSKYDNTDK